MAARSLDPHEVDRTGLHASGEAMRYQLDVVAHSIVDVVQHAGGWIFDRAVAGWEVTVLVTGGPDPRPLRILGAEVMDLDTVMAARGQGRRPHAVAVAADVCERNSRAHAGLLRALGDGNVEVVVWGESWMSPPEHQVDPVVHRLSVAAQAFKAQALTAAAVPDLSVGPTEIFRTGLSVFPPVGADLMPVG